MGLKVQIKAAKQRCNRVPVPANLEFSLTGNDSKLNMLVDECLR